MSRQGVLNSVLFVLLVSYLFGCAAIDGQDGEIGPQGPPGIDGTDGDQGLPGIDAVLEVIDPCGKQATNGIDEVLFRLADGRLFAYFENGGKRYLAIIPPGNYQTTDGTACNFTVTPDGQVL